MHVVIVSSHGLNLKDAIPPTPIKGYVKCM